MNINTRYYNKFLFFTEFARNLIELFIPSLIYEKTTDFKYVVLYLVFVSIFSLIISSSITLFYHRISDRFLVGFGGVCLFVLFLLMQTETISSNYLILIAFVYSLYRRCYWIGKRYYTVYTMSRENNAVTGGIIVTVTQITKLLTSVIAGVLLDENQMKILAYMALIPIFLGVYFLSKIKTDDKNDVNKSEISKLKKYKHDKVDFKAIANILKKHSISDLLVLFGYEGLFIIDFFLPLYLFIYVKNQHTFLGIQNFLLGIASIIFVLLFSKGIDHTKRDYIRIVTLCLITIIAFEINTISPWIILILSTIQGYFSKFHMVAYVRKLWCVDDDINKAAYNIFLEMFVCVGRLILTLIIFVLSMNIKMAIYLGMAFFILQAILKFKPNASL